MIIQETPGAGEEPEALVESFGGTAGQQLALIGGFEATVPADAFDELNAAAFIDTVTPNASLQLAEAEWGDSTT